jgi:hypothetical protein
VRNVIEGAYFADCVARLGGYRAIDRALETVIEALMRNPYGFQLIENDWVKIRYAKTAMIEGYIPPLIVAFTIDADGNVVLEWAELADEAEEPEPDF